MRNWNETIKEVVQDVVSTTNKVKDEYLLISANNSIDYKISDTISILVILKSVIDIDRLLKDGLNKIPSEGVIYFKGIQLHKEVDKSTGRYIWKLNNKALAVLVSALSNIIPSNEFNELIKEIREDTVDEKIREKLTKISTTQIKVATEEVFSVFVKFLTDMVRTDTEWVTIYEKVED